MSRSGQPCVDIMALNPEVTGSCNLVSVKFPDGEALRFVVDCGLFQEKGYDNLNETLPFLARNIDFCLVTHNHVDHIGRLPLLVKQGFFKPIYATPDTCKLMPIALADTHRILADIAKRKSQRCLYSEADVGNTIKQLRACEFKAIINVHPRVNVTFFKNGHLIGAALILVQIAYPGCENINLLFTGDYNNKNMFFGVPVIPKWVRKLPLTIVQESTYGDMNSTEMEKCFQTNIQKCLDNGGTAIVLVFSLGRAQEILYVLKCMQKEGKLQGIPIYLDGKLAIKYTQMFTKKVLEINSEMQDFLPENLILLSKKTRPHILASKEPKIVVTTSGMGSYGPAQQYIQEYLSDPKALIHFTGYTAEGTLGRKLKEAEKGKAVEVNGLVLKKKAQVEYTTEFSAHAKADEMIAFLKQFENLKLVLVNHGASQTKSIFADRILSEVKPKAVGILGRDYYFRVNGYGLVKTLSTKFMK